jgi:hypothetical protein
MPYFDPPNTYVPLLVGCPTTLIPSPDPATTVTRIRARTAVDGAISVESTSGWFHGDVFVTPVGDLTALENVPPLITVYTPTPTCIDRWMVKPPATCDNGPEFINIVWSVNPTGGIVSDPLYNECQLYNTATYSPGVCPSGQTVAEVTAYEWNKDILASELLQKVWCQFSLSNGD